ncbi:MAG: helix-turn-helix transcriptional regulator [Defluviitaleaceae bacterium]|nr:helix-turn-helix transcriptional regulator [Defluviitaleaceae bacterium]
MTTPPTSIGEKIKLIRTAKGFSQENLGKAISKSTTFISRLEKNDAELDNKTLEAIKKYLEIEKAPLTEHELELYRNRIWAWNDLVSARRMDDVKALQEELIPILDLHYEVELNMLYKMVLTRVLFTESNLPAAEEHLATVEANLDEASTDVLYLYHRNKGTLFSFYGNQKNSLQHSLQALEHNNDKLRQDTQLIFAIGHTYSMLGKPINALLYLERAKREYTSDLSRQLLNIIDGCLSVIYVLFGEFDKAKKITELALVRAKSYNDQLTTGDVLSALGTINLKLGNYKASVEYCDEALIFLKDKQGQEDTYLNTLATKALGLFQLKDYTGCDDVLNQGKALAKGDEWQTMQIEATRHFTTLNDSNSIDYLESVALPIYRAKGSGFIMMALGICKTLESHYRKKRATRKADAIAKIMRDIYEEMFF